MWACSCCGEAPPLLPALQPSDHLSQVQDSPLPWSAGVLPELAVDDFRSVPLGSLTILWRGSLCRVADTSGWLVPALQLTEDLL